MTTEARDALAKALHESAGTHSRPVLTRQICPGPSYHDAEADAILAALAGWTLVRASVADAERCHCGHLDATCDRAAAALGASDDE
jgi:hypothetical protein